MFKCEMHYREVYLEGLHAPLPSDHALRETHTELLDELGVQPAACPTATDTATIPGATPAPAPDPAAAVAVAAPPPGAAAAATPTPAKGKAKSKSRSRPKGKAKGKAKGKSAHPDPATPSTDSIQPAGSSAPGETSPPDGRSLLKRKDGNHGKDKPAEGSLKGFTWQRADFDVEFDDKAEELIADLAITDDDDDEVLALKCRLLEIYDRRLQVREAVKKIIFDRNLLDFKNLKGADRRDTRDEKELAVRLQVFKRILEPDKFQAFYESIMFEYRVAKDMYAYANGREHGLRTKAEIDVYEIDVRRRAAALGMKDMKQREVDDKKNQARTKASPTVPIAADGANAIPSSSPSPMLSLNGKPSVQPLPLGSANGTPAGCSENGSPITMDANMDAQAMVKGIPSELSKTAKQRRAREQRVLARSPYPQVSAMRVDRKEGVSALTEPEKILCSALRLLPMDFLERRDAMLRVSEELLSQKEGSENGMSMGVDTAVLVMRAMVDPTNVPSDENNEMQHLKVTSVPMGTNRSASTRVPNGRTKEEQVISGPRHRVRLGTATPNGDANIGVPVTTIPTDVKVTPVQIDRIPAVSQALQLQLTYCGAPEFDREENKEDVKRVSGVGGEGVVQRSTKVKLLLRPPKRKGKEFTEKTTGGNVMVASDTAPSKEVVVQDESASDLANIAVVMTKVLSSTNGPYETEEILSSGSAGFSDASKEMAQRGDSNVIPQKRKVKRRAKGRLTMKRKRSSRRVSDGGAKIRKLNGDHTQHAHRRELASKAEASGNGNDREAMASSDERQMNTTQAATLTADVVVDGNTSAESAADGDEAVPGTSVMREDIGGKLSPNVEVTEEILDEGNGNCVDRQSSEKTLSSGDAAENASRSDSIELVATTPRRGRKSGSVSGANGHRQQSTTPSPLVRTRRQKRGDSARKTNVGSKTREAGESRLRLKLKIPVENGDGSERSSVPSTPSAEDTGDKDFEMEDSGEEAETSVEKIQVRRNSRQTSATPTRKSSRLSDRGRGVDKSPTVAVTSKHSAADAEETKSGADVDVNGSATPDPPVKRKRGRPRKYPIGEGGAVSASGRKPPVTPRSGKKRGRPRRDETVERPPTKVARLSSKVYSLRRRGS